MLKGVINGLDKEAFILEDYKRTLRPIDDEIDSKKKAVKDEIIANEMELTIKFLKVNWEEAIDFAKNSNEFYEKDISLLSVFPKFIRGGREASPKQLTAINSILIKMKDEGLDI